MFIYVNMFIILIKLPKLERMIIRLSSTNTCLYSGLCTSAHQTSQRTYVYIGSG